MKDYKDLTFTDDFMFCKILSTNLEMCRQFVELVLNVKIRSVALPESQKSIEITSDGRGIRLDVYVEDDANTVYDLEMQTTREPDYAKRSRYYQGMIDLNLIERGSQFAALRKSYVVFICLSDYFGKNLPIYTFENICMEDKDICLNDEAIKVFVNASCNKPGLSDEIRSLFDFIMTGKRSDELTEALGQSVDEVIHSEKWRPEYMTLAMRDQMMLEKGRVEGRAEGRAEGEAKGRAEGGNKMLFMLVQNGKITPVYASEVMGIKQSQLKDQMTAEGYKWPEDKE